MKRWGISLGCAVALLSACGGSKPPVAEGRQPPPRPASSAAPKQKPRGNEAPLPKACEPSQISDARFSSDGSALVVGVDGRIDTYDTSTWKRWTRGLNVQGASSWRLSPDGRFLFAFVHPGGRAPSPSGHLEIVDTRDGKRRWRSGDLQGELYDQSVVIAHDGTWFAVAVVGLQEGEYRVELHGLPGMEPLGRFEMPTQISQLRRPSWRPRVVPAPPRVGGVPLNVPNAPPDWSADQVELQPSITQLAASPDSASLAISWLGSGGATSVIDVRSLKALVTLPGSYHAFSPTGRLVLLELGSGARALYDIRARKGALFYDPLCPPQGELFKPSFNPDESLVAFAGLSFASCLVETKTGKPRGLIAPQSPTTGAYEDEGFAVPGAWLSDGSGLVMAMSTAGYLQLFELGASRLKPLGTELRGESPMADNSAGYPVVIRREKDQSLVVFSQTGYPGVEIAEGNVRNLQPPEGDYASVAVTPDGERYARSDDAGTLVRSTRTGDLIATLEDAPALGLSFDPTGQLLFVAQPDGLRVWSAASGERVFSLPSCGK